MKKQKEFVNPVPMTNADRIRAMSDEELAAELGIKQCPDKDRWQGCSGDCEACWLEWLREPAEEAQSDG